MNYHQIKLEYLKAARICKSGRFNQAKQPLKWVLTHSRKYKSLHLDAGLALAGVYKRLSEYEFAIQMLNYLIESFEADTSIQSILHLDLALAKYHNGDPVGAKREASKASGYHSSSMNPVQLWFLLMMEGRYLSLCGKHQEAIKYQERAWPICEELRMDYRMMQVIANIGHNLLDLGDGDEGGRLVRRALKMACKDGDQYWAANNCLALMQLAFRKGNILEAKEIGKRCFRLAYGNGYRDIVEEACQSTGDYYRAIGDTDVADVFYQKAVSVGSESPAQVLEKVDRIYDTAYSERRLNVKFTSSGNKWVLDGSNDSTLGPLHAGKVLKYRYIIGSVKTKLKTTPRIDGEQSVGEGRTGSVDSS